MTLLSVSGLGVDARRREGTARVVDDVTFDLDRGETLGIVGESGSGKSVTAMSIIRLLPPALGIAAGSIHYEGRDLATASPRELRAIRGAEIGVVFQDPQNCLNPAYTIGNQMVEAIRAHRDLSAKEALELATSLLHRVGIPRPGKRIRDYPHQLSGGMAQRVMIAIAISCNPKLLIADEPTTALDVTVQAQILALLQSLQEETGMSLLLISHDLSVIAEMADRVAVMYAGQIVERGGVEPALTTPSHPYTEALLAAQPESTQKGERLISIPGSVPNADEMPPGCRFAPRCGHAVDVCTTRAVPLEVGRHDGVEVRCLLHQELELVGVRERAALATNLPVADPRVGERPLLAVRGLSKRYSLRSGRWGRRTELLAVDDVSFDLRAGETLGIVGESGAGKSTVGRMVLNLTPATTGEVRFDGVDVSAKARGAARKRRHRDIQVVFQNPYASLDPMMTVGASLGEPLDVHLSLRPEERAARVADLLRQVGLDPSYAGRSPHQLSGGQRQRVAIARSLALNPKLIVCDEPVSALDVSTQAQVVNLLRDLQEEFGIAYLFVGHDLSVVYQISDRVAVMYRGRIVEMGPSDEVYANPRHPYTRDLLDAVLAIDPRRRSLASRVPPPPGEEPSTVGCPYADRCVHVTDHCLAVDPEPVQVSEDVQVRCHLHTGTGVAVAAARDGHDAPLSL